MEFNIEKVKLSDLTPHKHVTKTLKFHVKVVKLIQDMVTEINNFIIDLLFFFWLKYYRFKGGFIQKNKF